MSSATSARVSHEVQVSRYVHGERPTDDRDGQTNEVIMLTLM